MKFFISLRSLVNLPLIQSAGWNTMQSLERFRTKPLARPPSQEIDLTVTSSTALPVSPATRYRVTPRLQASAPSPRHPNEPLLTSKRTFPGQRKYNTVQISEADRMFKLKLVETCAQQVLQAELDKVSYNPNTCRELSQVIAGLIMDRLKSFSLSQYKLVCVVSIGSLKDRPAMQFGSRCLWNKATDNFVSVKYTNASVFAVAMIYGLYFD
ncbi:TCTEX1 domain-containing protein 1 [Plakobranchus ocellatus]|uniref:TCTEX1 domain-containing protein 1 n=1 Tax=Plakobranchus ocellatus TaxID=259542 RepID=A0AAV4AT68_9GAST|nr:TCTEX1 domain-containing protein 1 [Plakobranchus ocellatus]